MDGNNHGSLVEYMALLHVVQQLGVVMCFTRPILVLAPKCILVLGYHDQQEMVVNTLGPTADSSNSYWGICKNNKRVQSNEYGQC